MLLAVFRLTIFQRAFNQRITRATQANAAVIAGEEKAFFQKLVISYDDCFAAIFIHRADRNFLDFRSDVALNLPVNGE